MLKEYHLFAFFLVYFSVQYKLNKNINLWHIKSLKDTHLVYLLILPALYLLVSDSAAFEHYVVLTSVVLGLKSIKYITDGEKVRPIQYTSAAFLSALLIFIYNFPVARKNMFFMYLTYLILCSHLIGNNNNKPSELIDDIVLSHMFFYLTK